MYSLKNLIFFSGLFSVLLFGSQSITAQDGDGADRGDRGEQDDSDRYQLYDRNREKNDFNEYSSPRVRSLRPPAEPQYRYSPYNSYLAFRGGGGDNDLYDRNREGRLYSNYDYPHINSYENNPDQEYTDPNSWPMNDPFNNDYNGNNYRPTRYI